MEADSWTGSDEAGKGDYMGPLTAAAVLADRRSAGVLRRMGITDSKVLSDSRVRQLAAELRELPRVHFSVGVILPREYNRRFQELHRKGRNSLDLLAQLHGSVIRELISRTGEPEMVLVDKFCPASRLKPHLPDGSFRLVLRTGAESDPAVAAASVLARDAYLSELSRISGEFGIKAVSGSGSGTDEVVRKYVQKFGPDILDDIVKLHFRNTGRILDLFSSL